MAVSSAPEGAEAAAAPAAAVAPAIALAKAFVVDDFGRKSPELLRDDFVLSTRGERLTKKRYLKETGDLDALQSACGGSLVVSVSDYRLDGEDGNTVWFSVSLSGTHQGAYEPPTGVEGAALAPTKKRWATPPSGGSCSFDDEGRCYLASLGMPEDRNDVSRGAEGLFVPAWLAMGGRVGFPATGRQFGLALSELVVKRTPATARGEARSDPPHGEATMVEIADAALKELVLLPPDGVLGDRVRAALFADDCVVVGAAFPAMPLGRAASKKPWGDTYWKGGGVALENYRVSAVDARRVVADARLPSGEVQVLGVHVDDDERVFRVSLGFVLRPEPSLGDALAGAIAPLERAAEDALGLKEELDKNLEPVLASVDVAVASFEANTAVLNAAVAEANAKYATAKADLEAAVAEYEAKYEEIVAPSKALAADVSRTVEDVNDQVEATVDEVNRTIQSFISDPLAAFAPPPTNASSATTSRRLPQAPPPPKVRGPRPPPSNEDLVKAQERFEAAARAADRAKADAEAEAEKARVAAARAQTKVEAAKVGAEKPPPPRPPAAAETAGASVVELDGRTIFARAPDTPGARIIDRLPPPPPPPAKPAPKPAPAATPAPKPPAPPAFEIPTFSLPKPKPKPKPKPPTPAPTPAPKPPAPPAFEIPAFSLPKPKPTPTPTPAPKPAASKPASPPAFASWFKALKPKAPKKDPAPPPPPPQKSPFSFFGTPPTSAPAPAPKAPSPPRAKKGFFGAPTPTPAPAPKPPQAKKSFFGAPAPAPAPAPKAPETKKAGFSFFGAPSSTADSKQSPPPKAPKAASSPKAPVVPEALQKAAAAARARQEAKKAAAAEAARKRREARR